MSYEDLVERGRQLANDAEEELKGLLEQRGALDEQIKRVRELVRLMGGRTTDHKKPPKAVATIARETLVQVAKACAVIQNGADTFTVHDVADSLELHDSTIRIAFTELREREFIRKLPGRGSDRREHYAILDSHVLDLLIASSENGNATTS